MNRRQFLQTAAAGAASTWLGDYRARAANELGRHKIRSLKTMVLQGPDRNYTYVKLSTDSGVYGIGEGYGVPGAGIKEQMMALEPLLVGKDVLEIEKNYVGLSRHTDGSAHMFMRGISGIEMAMWDAAGKILEVPVHTLLGGAYRDKVRMYNHNGPRNPLDKASCKDWAQKRFDDPSGWNCCKFGPSHTDQKDDPARDYANKVLTTMELRNIRKGFENCREALGDGYDMIVHCHWEYDLRTAIDLAAAVGDIKPLYLEDPLGVDYTESWKRLVEMAACPIGKGENLARREGFLPFIVNAAIDVLNPDLRNTGGLLETKKIADFAAPYFIPFYNHNTGSVLCTMATVQWAASIRDYIACETVVGKRDWMDDVIVRDKPMLVNGGFIEVPKKPGLGVELNKDVVTAHLGTGETWWGDGVG
jgi:L-alanine-DL-glutamate epimerase-like enolase superfamily enzyme